MNLAERFGRLLARLWPLWVPLLLVVAWPFARPIAREQIFGSSIARDPLFSLSEIWGELIWGGYQPRVNPLPDAATQPDDLDLQIWQWSWGRERNEIGLKPQDLVKRFPDEIVVYALAIRELDIGAQLQSAATSTGGNKIVATAPKGVARLKILAQKAAQLEPDNAYWWVQLALAEALNERPQAALLALERAAICPIYDDKSREIARRSLAAFDSRRALSWEEKRAIVLDSQFSDGARNARFWGSRARSLAENGDAGRALRWSAALAGVGALMGGENSSLALANIGRVWQREAWSIGAPRGTTMRQRNTVDYSENFALYAIKNGRADLARPTRAQAARARQTDALINANRARADDDWLGHDGMGAALRSAHIGGIILMGAAIYLALWWLAANVFLWRGVGEPSRRRARVLVSGGAVAALLGMAIVAGLWFWRDSLRARAGVVSPQHDAMEAICISLSIFAFFAAPWLLALTAATSTLWRARAQFALQPRVDLELQLSRFSRRLLRWALPLAVAASALALLGGWALTIIAIGSGWKNLDLLAWLPPDRNGLTGSLLWSPAGEPWILLYGAWLCFLCLIGWFAKWRWATPQRLRPLTHRALRGWKESLGCAVGWLMWVYLLLILSSLPTRSRAETRLNAVLQRGEIAVMRDLSKGN